MDFNKLIEYKNELKAGFILAIGEKLFTEIDENDERYPDGREALDKCWQWAEKRNISADDLYELIDNADCTGISEFAEDEEDPGIAGLWCFLVDIVSYISWMGYKKENTKYLPQALEGIREDSIIVLTDSAVETGFITHNEVLTMKQKFLSDYKSDDDIIISKDEFMRKVLF